jgi:hypothetical protein
MYRIAILVSAVGLLFPLISGCIQIGKPVGVVGSPPPATVQEREVIYQSETPSPQVERQVRVPD